MTDEHARLRRFAEKAGMTVEEGRVFDALITLSYYWHQLPDLHPRENMEFSSSYDHIAGMLAVRVAKRAHPEGWRTVGEVEDMRKEEGKAP